MNIIDNIATTFIFSSFLLINKLFANLESSQKGPISLSEMREERRQFCYVF